MNITFLDASTLDRGDIDFHELEALGFFRSYPTTAAEEAMRHSTGAEVLISNKVPITREMIETLPSLKLVVSAATGVNQIDIKACQDAGVAVTNVAGYSTASVVQHTFAFMLELATRVATLDRTVRSDWPASPIFTRLDHPLFELAGKTLGIVGLGTIGLAVAQVAQAMGMRVIALQREGCRPHAEITRCPQDVFFQEADVITLHCPLTPETERFINRDTIKLMKPGALLINTGRGPLIDEQAVAQALRSGELAGAGLDVLSIEPPPPDHPLLAADLPNLLITPHTAWSTREARNRLLEGIVENIQSFYNGGRLNRLD